THRLAIAPHHLPLALVKLQLIFAGELGDQFWLEQAFFQAAKNSIFQLADGNRPAIAASALFAVNSTSDALLADDGVGAPACAATHQPRQQAPWAPAVLGFLAETAGFKGLRLIP